MGRRYPRSVFVQTTTFSLILSYEWALHLCRHLNWRKGSTKVLIMIGDSHPHPPSFTSEKIYWKDEVRSLREIGVKIYGVHAGNTPENPFGLFYRYLAKM